MTLGPTVFTIARVVLAAGVYRWVDEQGKVHYGDRPPSEAKSTPLEIEAAPTPSPENKRRRAKIQRLLNATEPGPARAQAEAEQARKARNCETARRKVAFYERANSLFRLGPDGERLYSSDKDPVRARSQTRALVDQMVQMNPVSNRILAACGKWPGNGDASFEHCAWFHGKRAGKGSFLL